MKKKVKAAGFEPETYRLEVTDTTHALQRHPTNIGLILEKVIEMLQYNYGGKISEPTLILLSILDYNTKYYKEFQV